MTPHINFRCSHPRTDANRMKNGRCKTCNRINQENTKRRQLVKAKPRFARKPWIVPTSADYKARMAAALEQYRRETGEGQAVRDQQEHNLWGPR